VLTLLRFESWSVAESAQGGTIDGHLVLRLRDGQDDNY
jgi:hypothetical protein